MQPHYSLAPGIKLHWYQIESVLGHGGFGLTYLALDTNLNQKVAIKEYLPGDLADREDDNTTVRPRTENHEQLYAWGLDRFLKEARTLVQFKHPNIVRVMSVFEANNTAYMVMEYEEGQDLECLMRAGKYRTERELKSMAFPIMDGLVQVHEAGFIHRDIKPGNIYIRADGSPVLLDFGSARQSVGSKTQAMTSLYTPGFAPFEQYHEAEGRQGPWTDVYALGAMLYLGATGKRPADALKRSASYLHQTDDPYIPVGQLAKGKFSKAFLNAVDRALSFRESDRPADTEAFKLLLDGKKPRARQKVSAPKIQTTSPASQRQGRLLTGLVALFVLAGIGLTGYWWWMEQAQTPLTGQSELAQTPSKPAVSKSVAATDQTRINALLEQARADLKKRRLIAPKGNNALDHYRDVLKLDEHNTQAQAGVKQIIEQVVQQIERVITSGQLDRAEGAIKVAEKTIGAVPAIGALKQQLNSARAEEQQEIDEAERLASEAQIKKQQAQQARQQQADQEKARLASVAETKQRQAKDKAATHQRKQQQRVSQLLVQAASDIAAGRLANTPDNNDALSRYQQILKLDPGNASALKGITTLTEKLTAQTQAAARPVASAEPVSVMFVVYADQRGNHVGPSRKMGKIIQNVTKNVMSSRIAINYQGVRVEEDYFVDSLQQDVAKRLCAEAKVTHLLAANFERATGGFSEDMYVSAFNCTAGYMVNKRYEIYYESEHMLGGSGGDWSIGWKESIRKFLRQERPFRS